MGTHYLHLRHDTTAEKSRSVDTVCTQKHSGSEHSGLNSAELLDVQHATLRVHGKSHTCECKYFQDAWKESRTCRRRATAKRGDEADQDTRPRDPSSSSTDPDPKRFKPTIMTNVENLAEQMDEDTSLRTPATSLPLVLDAEENVSKKSRVARNALYICGEDELKSQRRRLAERRTGNSPTSRGRLGRRTSRRQSQSWRSTRNHADEQSAAVFLDQRGSRILENRSCSSVGHNK